MRCVCDLSLHPKCIHYVTCNWLWHCFQLQSAFLVHNTHTHLLPPRTHTHLTVQNDTVPMRASLGQVVLDVCNLAEMKQEGGGTLQHRHQRSGVRGQRPRWMQAILHRYRTCGPFGKFHHCLGTVPPTGRGSENNGDSPSPTGSSSLEATVL